MRRCRGCFRLAERGGFEPPEPFGSSAFKAGAFVRSATVPSTTLTRRGRGPLAHSSCPTAWMTNPARPPTTVPLIRMNWRSRPTCSSSLRGGRVRIPLRDGRGDDLADLGAVVRHEVGECGRHPVVDLALQFRFGREALSQPLGARHDPAAQLAVRIVDGEEHSALGLAPQRLDPATHLWMVEQLLFQFLTLRVELGVLAEATSEVRRRGRRRWSAARGQASPGRR